MKTILKSSLMAVALVLSSCSTYQYTARQTNINRQDINMAPTVVDVKPDYAKRIEVTSGWCNTKEEAMNECKYMAITTQKIDVVVDPIYKLEFRKGKLSKNFKATLTGFAGYYTNSRTMYEDMEQLKKFSREEIENYLIMHNPEVLKYLNAQGDVVNIFHGGHQPAPRPAKGADMKAPDPVSVQQPPVAAPQQSTSTQKQTQTQTQTQSQKEYRYVPSSSRKK
ncbi:MAG: hypothetical protein IKP02_02960 [Paludibacteraceae bacterium]|nr:hypothetical protein [Paludibacteraceae bacterium]